MRRYINDFKSFKLKESRDDEYINYLLDKINKKGIDSLSDAEKNRLNQIKNIFIQSLTICLMQIECFLVKLKI